MSVKVMSAVFDHSKSTLGSRLVLLAMADIARDHGMGCHFSMKTLARKAGLSERGARDAVRKLEELGEVRTSVRGGRKKTNAYMIVLPTIENPADIAEYGFRDPAESAPSNPAESADETSTNRRIEGSKEPSRGSEEKENSRSRYTREEQNAIWDSLTVATGSSPLTKTERSIRGKCVRELLEAGATPGDIETRSGRWRDIYASATLTDLALVKHWSMLKPPEPPPSQYPTREEYAAAGIEW